MHKNLFFLLLTIVTSIHISNAQYKPSAYKATKKYFSMPEYIKPDEYKPKTIILKVKPEYRSLCGTHQIADEKLNSFLNKIEAGSFIKKFPRHQAPDRMYNEKGEKLADLSLIYQLKYSSDQFTLEKVINALYAFQLFEFAEPCYIPKIDNTPNDPGLSSQWHLNTINAYNGWDISKGDTNVVIGIIDTGTEPNHEDLKDNIKHNYADPVNGVDDDNDGYTDNYTGWDLGENDNNTVWQGDAHGVHVSGLAAAVTNNATGIAGVGYNCKFLPVKIADATGTLTGSYEGIAYAADHGCNIINCSWGSSYGGQYGQTIIDYATINQNALVIASAGNDGIETEFYPAAYNYVIAVANTSTNDKKHGSSNYGHWIDVCAPGVSLYSTYYYGSYTTMTGTSMSAPVTAGAAAIIKSYYPSYTALQIGEQLRMSCDDVSSANPNYTEKLGRGRIDLYNALTQTSSPSVVMTSRTITDNNNDVFLTNDTLSIYGDYTNYLAATTSALTATLTSGSSYVTILNNQVTLGSMNTLDVTNNNSNPFSVKINSNAPQNVEVDFSILYQDGTYTTKEYFTVTLNVDYINIAINDIATSITSKGRIGYNGTDQKEGLGFTYMGGESMLFEAGLMIGTSSSKVSDMVRGESTLADEDFDALTNVEELPLPVISEFDLQGSFNDAAASTPINVNIEHHAYAWDIPGHTKYVILEYFITNGATYTFYNLYAGIFADWDIDGATYDENRAEYDNANKMGYAYYTGAGSTYVGIKLLSTTAPAMHYAIDNSDGGEGGVDMFDGYTSTDKYMTLSTNRTSAGTSGSGNDICDVMSSGPFTIGTADTAVLAFALIAGDDLTDLQNSAINAQAMYDSIRPQYTGIKELENNNTLQVEYFPNPANKQVSILYKTEKKSDVEIKLYNTLGESIALYTYTDVPAGIHQQQINISNFRNGLYYLNIKTNNASSCLKLLKND